MGSKLEFKGKDVDEAITKACDKLHVTREELDIQIISTGSSGIFGLCKKQAVIRASRKEAAPEPQKTRHKKTPAPQAVREKAEPLPAQDMEEVVERQAPAVAETQPDREMKKKRRTEERPQEPEAPLEPLTPEILEQIRNDLDRLLTLMGFSSEIAIEEKNNKAWVKISGDHISELTTKDGQALDSIQYLMRKIIGNKFPQKIMFAIDAGEFREQRRAELQELALKLAAEVKETEKTRTIPALNPAERRIVHLVLQEDKTIRSRSVGDGVFKKILIYLPGKGRVNKRPPRRKAKKEKLTIPE